MKRFSTLALALALAGAASASAAQEVMVGKITVDKAWARATPKGAEVGAGYLTLHNDGAIPDTLTCGSADFATVEIHEMKSEGGVMKMAPLKNGLTIPPHGTVKLSPGGYHIMFTHLKKPLVKGETVTATLDFAHAGAVAVRFPVQGVGAAAPGAAKGGAMGGMKM
jgi:periplasmic copper chaperone A